MKRYCAHCGAECEFEYYKVLDNFLQVKYFDSDEDNCFCSQECFCEFVMLDSFDVEESENDDDSSNA